MEVASEQLRPASRSRKRKFRMNRIAAGALTAFFCCPVHFAAFAGDFKSAVITPAGSTLTIPIPDEHYVRIINFTQEGGAQRGVVTVTSNGQTGNVLTAAMISKNAPPSSSVPEPIEKVVIPGPAQVSVAPVDGATLFISYKKYVEPAETPTPSPTPTATATATATPTPTPTATPTPTPTPVIAAITVLEPTSSSEAETDFSSSESTPTPTPTSATLATPTATPTPTASPDTSIVTPTPTPPA